jgi:hypothetical protein
MILPSVENLNFTGCPDRGRVRFAGVNSDETATGKVAMHPGTYSDSEANVQSGQALGEKVNNPLIFKVLSRLTRTV